MAFTVPCVGIEDVYVTNADAPFQSSDEVDREGVRIGVREGSAYDLFLTRSLVHAKIVRAHEATDVYEAQRLDVAAGSVSRWRSTSTEADVGSSNRP